MLCLAHAIHNYMDKWWELLRFDKIEVKDFEIVLIDVTFYLFTCLKAGT